MAIGWPKSISAGDGRVHRGGPEVEHGELKIFSFPVTFFDGLLDRLHLALNEAV